MATKRKDLSPAVSGNEGKPTRIRDIPPRLPALRPHLHGLPMPVKVKVKGGMNAATPSPSEPTDGTRRRKRSR